jgi:hypothetical protein
LSPSPFPPLSFSKLTLFSSQSKRENEGRAQLLGWQNRITQKFKSSLVQPHRSLVKSGTMVRRALLSVCHSSKLTLLLLRRLSFAPSSAARRMSSRLFRVSTASPPLRTTHRISSLSSRKSEKSSWFVPFLQSHLSPADLSSTPRSPSCAPTSSSSAAPLLHPSTTTPPSPWSCTPSSASSRFHPLPPLSRPSLSSARTATCFASSSGRRRSCTSRRRTGRTRRGGCIRRTYAGRSS